MTRLLARVWEICTTARNFGAQFLFDARKVGLRAAVVMLFAELTTRRPFSYILPPRKRVLKLRLKGYRFPLYFRHWSTDLGVIRQVFCDEEYGCIQAIRTPGFIVDAGANIGCTSFYLLHRYPGSMVVAVEPDQQNYDLCARNLAPFGERVRVLKQGLWSEAVGLRVVAGARGTGEWALEVRPSQPGEAPDVEAIGMRDLLCDSPAGQIDLLKIDIEGAENQVFSDTDGWLDRVHNIVIELHGEACSRTFFHALRDYRYDTRSKGELLLCSDLRRQSSEPVEQRGKV